ncbi:MAG: hypothetical protein WCC11_00490 [Gammaproteobacteria bacterium]
MAAPTAVAAEADSAGVAAVMVPETGTGIALMAWVAVAAAGATVVSALAGAEGVALGLTFLCAQAPRPSVTSPTIIKTLKAWRVMSVSPRNLVANYSTSKCH